MMLIAEFFASAQGEGMVFFSPKYSESLLAPFLDLSKFSKTALIFDLSHFSNSVFSETTGLISSIKFLIENLAP